MAKFSEVLTIINGKNQSKVENPNGRYPIYGSGGIMGYADDYLCDAQTVVIGRKGSINKPIFVEEPFWNVDTAFGLAADRKVLHPKYLFYFCVHFDFEQLNTTVTIPSLTKANLLNIEMPLPNLDVQQVIVDRLSKIDSLIALRKEQLAKLDELVKARFVEMFGTEDEFSKWFCCTIGDVAAVCVGVVIKPTQYYAENGIPAFRSLNIGPMRVKDSDWVYFTEEGHRKNQKSVIRKNDVLVVRSGAPGTACVVTDEYDGYNAVDIIIAHPKPNKVDSVFLAAFTNMPHGMNQIRERSGGAAQQHFNVGGYKAMNLILPPMELQKQFAAFVEQTNKTKLTIQASLDKLEVMKKALMQEYFG